MYGEGYDYVPQYNPMCGNMVGALPVGLGARRNDEPYWPAGNNEPSRREMWVQTVTRFINLAARLNGPAVVEGRTDSVIEFKDRASGIVTRVTPEANGSFRALLAEGQYVGKAGGFEKHVILLPGGRHKLDLSLDFTVVSSSREHDQVTIEVTARGTGSHKFTMRAENLAVLEPEKDVVLRSGSSQKLTWEGRINSPDCPWVVVVFPDGDLSQRKELLDRQMGR
jgi:hypothetical protein